MVNRPCSEVGCPRHATAKGRCDLHRRAYERARSTQRRGGYSKGPYANVVAARDANDSQKRGGR
jgi:hypothetical protein